MCFTREMRDIVPKEIPDNYGKDLPWYIEELLLAYKYNDKSRYFKSLNYIKKYDSNKRLTNILQDIGDRSITLK